MSHPFPSLFKAQTSPLGSRPSRPRRSSEAERVVILEPGRAERDYWRDLWHYRELFAILAWRDTAVRYKQTVIGIAWAVIRPLLTMAIFTVVFGRVAKLPSDGAAPYAIWFWPACCPGSCSRASSARLPTA